MHMAKTIGRIGAMAAGLLASWAMAAGQAKSPEGIPRNQEDKIRVAAPAKPRVAPK